MKRQHPIALLKYTSKNFWLLLIPLVRGLFALRFDFYGWLRGAYVDVLVLMVIMGLAYAVWRNVQYETTDDGINVSKGLFIKEKFFIPYKAMSSVSSKRPLWLRPLNAVEVMLETDSYAATNKTSEPDCKLTLSFDEYKRLFNYLPNEESGAKLSYKAPKAKLLLFSLLFSSTLSGLIFFGTFLIQGGKLVDRELEERFFTAVNDVTEVARRLISGITPVTVGIIIVLAAGWLYSFTENYLRHMNFRVQRCGKSIFVRSGFFSKWKCHINSQFVNYADLRQNLLMKACRVMSVHISCSGYGKKQNEIPVFVPVTMRKNVLGVMRMLLPEFQLKETTIYPHWNYIMRFIGPPMALIFGVMAAAFSLLFIIPDWYSVIFFAAIMGEILSVHLLAVKLAAFYTNSIGFEDNTLSLKYCRFFQFHHLIVPTEKITSVEIYQTVFQRMNQSCDFIVYTKGEGTNAHRVRGLNFKDAERFVHELGYGDGLA